MFVRALFVILIDLYAYQQQQTKLTFESQHRFNKLLIATIQKANVFITQNEANKKVNVFVSDAI